LNQAITKSVTKRHKGIDWAWLLMHRYIMTSYMQVWTWPLGCWTLQIILICRIFMRHYFKVHQWMKKICTKERWGTWFLRSTRRDYVQHMYLSIIILKSVHQWQNCRWKTNICAILLKISWDLGIWASDLDVANDTVHQCATHLNKIILQSMNKWQSYALDIVRTGGQWGGQKYGPYKNYMPLYYRGINFYAYAHHSLFLDHCINTTM
jgi:hypothetical protein